MFPQQIVVVASGTDIVPEISTYKDKLNIDYIFSEVVGQVSQKKLGLKVINPEIDWVVFLDDDVIVCPDTFSSAFKAMNSSEIDQDIEISGVGFGISSTSRANKMGKLSKFLARFFLIYSYTFKTQKSQILKTLVFCEVPHIIECSLCSFIKNFQSGCVLGVS